MPCNARFPKRNKLRKRRHRSWPLGPLCENEPRSLKVHLGHLVDCRLECVASTHIYSLLGLHRSNHHSMVCHYSSSHLFLVSVESFELAPLAETVLGHLSNDLRCMLLLGVHPP